ncbi:MAG: glycosyltransferase [Candidatus Gastranaerophilales bacterium]|nr:glycosyltransferase [Candidatus Gastranaerophilales bacterium]
MTKFSIIVPVYNVESYLEESLNSVKNQTLNDFEVICINDGSTDNSLNILEKFAANDNRFKVYSQENQGQGISRNKAIDIAQGEYILFVDPDDWIELNALEKIYDYFKKTNADVIQFNYKEYVEQYSILREVDLKENLLNKYSYDITKTNTYNCISLNEERLVGINLAVWTKAYSASYIKANNIKCAPNKHAEDHIFSLMAVLCTENVYFLDEYLYTYRIRVGSSVNKTSIDNLCIFENIKLVRDFLLERNLFDILEKDYREYMQNVLVWHYIAMPEENQEDYKIKTMKILTKTEYEDFLQKTKGSDNSFWQNIFSLRNKRVFGLKYKCLTILGLSFSFKKPKEKRKSDYANC